MNLAQIAAIRHPVGITLLGLAAVALVTLMKIGLRLGSAPAALLDLLIVVLVSRTGSFVPAAVVSAFAIGCLNYVFSPRGAQYGLLAEVLELTAFLLAVVVITRLFARWERAAKLADERAHLLDIAHDAVCITRQDDRLIYWSRGAEALYGWKAEEALGRSAHELLQTTSAQPIEEIAGELLRTGSWQGELYNKTRDGTPVIVESRSVVQRDASGAPVAFLVTANDITARKHAEQALREAQTALIRATRVNTLGEVSANLAHELNQPLGAIVNNVHACLALLPGNAELEEVREALSDIAAAAEHGSAVIQRVRALATRVTPDLVEVRLADVVRDVLALADPVASGIEIRADVPDDLPVVLGVRVQLQQVLLNFILNAIDAMRDVESERRIRIVSVVEETEDAGPAVVIRVEDRGIGLRPGEIDRLFEAYYTTKPHGMGLGLAICRSIITAHGGHLWAEPNPEGGAVFSVRLRARTRS